MATYSVTIKWGGGDKNIQELTGPALDYNIRNEQRDLGLEVQHKMSSKTTQKKA